MPTWRFVKMIDLSGKEITTEVAKQIKKKEEQLKQKKREEEELALQQEAQAGEQDSKTGSSKAGASRPGSGSKVSDTVSKKSVPVRKKKVEVEPVKYKAYFKVQMYPPDQWAAIQAIDFALQKKPKNDFGASFERYDKKMARCDAKLNKEFNDALKSISTMIRSCDKMLRRGVEFMVYLDIISAFATVSLIQGFTRPIVTTG